MADIVYRQMPTPWELPQQIPTPPTQKRWYQMSDRLFRIFNLSLIRKIILIF